ncbi:phosphomannomutase [Exophiala viscosa]|uniref:Phosphomannomutase n=1 Tax=Exophiala viscosa TaxID=2486360 RepID=A0AAN6E043_9EURO|nr:phosphomannomutase [Exophiala viscosa]KAI1621355.1 phosphomannomutase [Exophiala viscosa]
MAELYPDLKDRPVKETICLFDVDGTLTPARQSVSAEMLQALSKLRHKCAIGFVGGSDLVKQQEQLGTPSLPVTTLFDFCFAENGLTAYRLGQSLPANSFLQWLGEEKYQKLAKFCLRYISGLEGLPAMRGTFIEFRNGMINVSPVGRNASKVERDEFEAWDKTTKCRAQMIAAIKKEFPDMGLTYSIGGQISFDVFPHGWDKTYCLTQVEAEADTSKGFSGVHYKNIHFFGDKAFQGGNDWEIYQDPRTTGHAVKGPEDTMAQLKELFDV